MPPTLLDLFCGAGGAAKGYQRAGFDVVGVDINPQPNYPFTFREGDALIALERALFYRESGLRAMDFDLGDFDAIHASPPCQRWSSKTRNPENHPDLITPVRELLEEAGLPYVIENVPRAPLVNPIQLCGSSFGLGVRRHRLFESNVPLLDLPCRHAWQKPRFKVYDHGHWYHSGTVPVYGEGGGKAREYWGAELEVDWMTDAEMAESIPPVYTRYIGAQLVAHIESARVARGARL